MDLRVLIVANECPFPPRNGVTIPIANYIILMREQGITVDLALLQPGFSEVTRDIPYVNRVFEVSLYKNKLTSICKELCRQDFYSSVFEVKGGGVLDSIVANKYSAIIYSPLMCCNFAANLKAMLFEKHGVRPIVIAAISDCYSAQLLNDGEWRKFLGIPYPSAKKIVSILRYINVRKIEPRKLQAADYIFVQSRNDFDWLERISSGGLKKSLRVLTNGVDERLFEIQRTEQHAEIINFCFVASLDSDYYKEKLLWLYNTVWKLERKPNLKLYVFGRGLSKADMRFAEIFADPTVVLDENFYEDISDIYRHMDVAFAPIFKSYGYINKVGEALASGMIVIGDYSAFNGIDGFLGGMHGLVAEDDMQFRKAIQFVSQEFYNNCLRELRVQARELANASIRWKSRSDILMEFTRRMN